MYLSVNTTSEFQLMDPGDINKKNSYNLYLIYLFIFSTIIKFIKDNISPG